jgi:tetratricopeptide (TPR) repeat protein
MAATLLGSVCTLNNEGANLIEKSQYITAIHTLGKALAVLQEVKATEARDRGTFDATPSSGCRRCSQNRDRSFSSHCGISTSSNQSWRAHDVHAPLHRAHPSNVFPYPLAPKASNCHYATLATSLAFNFALAHHLKAIEMLSANMIENARVLFRDALQLFQVANNILWEAKTESYLVRAAILNNVAHILTVLRNDASAGQCLEKLLSVLMRAGHGSGVHHHDLERFFQNVMHLILVPSYAAHAA